VIDTALFVLCLDGDSTDTARDLLCGAAGQRWFDKSIQLIVFPDGTYGLNGEHSKLDGMPTHRFGEFLATYNAPKNGVRKPSLPIPKELEFRFTPQLLREIEDSAKRFESLAKEFELHVFVFQDYGKKFIQQHNLSPDAYFQVALNWTYQRMIGRLCATYESASTKKFMNGRTEVGRTCTAEAAQWINSMNSLVASPKEKQELLRKACQAHTDYMKEAVENHGVDRLLLGLKLIARENGFEEHPIFRDVGYTLSTHWNLSTSQLSSQYFFVGFGPVVPDGFGVCYCLRGSSICASITSFSTHPLTRTTRFAQELAKSFLHMKILLETKTEASL
jgi:carnitine O-acetyltransferase